MRFGLPNIPPTLPPWCPPSLVSSLPASYAQTEAAKKPVEEREKKVRQSVKDVEADEDKTVKQRRNRQIKHEEQANEARVDDKKVYLVCVCLGALHKNGKKRERYFGARRRRGFAPSCRVPQDHDQTSKKISF